MVHKIPIWKKWGCLVNRNSRSPNSQLPIWDPLLPTWDLWPTTPSSLPLHHAFELLQHAICAPYLLISLRPCNFVPRSQQSLAVETTTGRRVERRFSHQRRILLKLVMDKFSASMRRTLWSSGRKRGWWWWALRLARGGKCRRVAATSS